MSRRQGKRPARVPLADGAIPRATYRVQLHGGFRFSDAAALVPYLAALGISHLYCSPYLKARPGSRHGYDIVDHATLNPEIGTRADFDALVAELTRHRMTQLCDVVPNHMAIMGRDNAWWMDVLEHGQASRYAAFFDIDWAPPDPDVAGKVLVPVLGGTYGKVLERGELALAFERDSGSFAVSYFEHRLPLDPRECAALVDRALGIARARLDAATADAMAAIADGLRALPARNESDAQRIDARRRVAPALKQRLAELAQLQPAIADAIDEVVRSLNGTPGTPESFLPLHRLLEAQAFRLAYWRVASDEINYRRFFDVNDLASLRMEVDDAFAATHALVIELAVAGAVGGLRIDHPDGLADPAGYFERLQSRFREAIASRNGKPTDDTAGLYVVIEKIAASHEAMPATWPVHGDTGYPFANAITAVLIDPTTRGRLDRTWRAFVGDEALDFERVAVEAKRTIVRGPLAAGLNVLAGQALRIARADPHTRDFTLQSLRDALAETVAWFPVYRTYVSARGHSADDARYIDWAVSRARRASRVDAAVFDFLRSLLVAGDGSRLDFAMRFQQFTAPVAAKGVEDTAFYRHVRFVALNEVGGEPGQLGITRRAFHRITAQRAKAWPHTLLATSTHDNKRSEDVRARLAAISETPAAWRLTVRRWSRMNRSRKGEVDGATAPSRSDEYLFYQTLVGSFPPRATGTGLEDYRERMLAYMQKAAREAKLATSWLNPDAGYEQALAAFVAALLTERPDNRFLDDVRAQAQAFAWFGMLNSLSMTLVKLASPGVPDFYQGNELLDLSLVDPDNRRPVDYARRRELLDALHRRERELSAATGDTLRALFDDPFDGVAKLWVVQRLLAFRKREPALFERGDYLALQPRGERERSVLSFARRHEGHGLVAVAGRLFASLGVPALALPLGDAWSDTTIAPPVEPGTVVTDLLSGVTFESGAEPWALARLFAHFPGAVLAW